MEPEAVVDSIIDDYLNNGNVLIQELEDAHQKDRREIQQSMNKLTATLAKHYEDSRTYIQRKTKAVKTSSINHLEKDWGHQQRELQDLICPKQEYEHSRVGIGRRKNRA